jgi:hypothetical protein
LFQVLRPAVAQHLANLGVPLWDIRVLLGHENPQTTMIYFRVSDPNLGRMFNNFGTRLQTEPMVSSGELPKGALLNGKRRALLYGAPTLHLCYVENKQNLILKEVPHEDKDPIPCPRIILLNPKEGGGQCEAYLRC